MYVRLVGQICGKRYPLVAGWGFHRRDKKSNCEVLIFGIFKTASSAKTGCSLTLCMFTINLASMYLNGQVNLTRLELYENSTDALITA